MTLVTDARRIDGVSGASRLLSALPAAALLLDFAVLAGSIFAAAHLRRSGFLLDDSADFGDLTVLGSVIVVGWAGLIALRGGYDHDVFGVGVDEYKRVAVASATAAGALGIACYFAKYDLSRGFYGFAFAVAVPSLLAGRFLLRRALKRARAQGHLRQRVLLVGGVRPTDDIARVLQRETWLGYELVGALTPSNELSAETPCGLPILGNAEEVIQIAPLLGADVVFFSDGGLASAKEMRRTVWELERHRIDMVVAPTVTDVSKERVQVRPVAGLPLIHVQGTGAVRATRWAKRTFDVVGSLLLMLIASPILATVAAVIWLHDRGPVVFRHTRIGHDGADFTCLKFRTMVPNADAGLAALREQRGKGALLFKDKDDPRITTPGKWLRRYSIDELPQLFNVLRGDMSLVGPRPQVADEVAQYDEFMARRLHVRPGMTGLWQVSGRNELSVDDAVRLDLYYVDNWSMMQDLVILLRTVRAVVAGSGAY